MSKGKEVASSRPTRRSQRAKGNKPYYRVDSVSEETNSPDRGAKDSEALRLEDFSNSVSTEGEPIQVLEKMTKVQWESIGHSKPQSKKC